MGPSRVVDRDLLRLDPGTPKREGQDLGVVVVVADPRGAEGRGREGAVAGLPVAEGEPREGVHEPGEQHPVAGNAVSRHARSGSRRSASPARSRRGRPTPAEQAGGLAGVVLAVAVDVNRRGRVPCRGPARALSEAPRPGRARPGARRPRHRRPVRGGPCRRWSRRPPPGRPAGSRRRPRAGPRRTPGSERSSLRATTIASALFAASKGAEASRTRHVGGGPPDSSEMGGLLPQFAKRWAIVGRRGIREPPQEYTCTHSPHCFTRSVIASAICGAVLMLGAGPAGAATRTRSAARAASSRRSRPAYGATPPRSVTPSRSGPAPTASSST